MSKAIEENLSLELVREWVIASHMDLAKVKQMLAEHPSLLNAAYPWKEDDNETAIQAAAQMGNAPMAEYLLSKGAPMEICTAAMLGRKQEVEHMLGQDANKITATGAHGIPLLVHAALSGNLELVRLLYGKGATQGVSFAFHSAVSRDDVPMSKWFLENSKPDLKWKDFQGKTALTVATEKGYRELAQLLQPPQTSA